MTTTGWNQLLKFYSDSTRTQEDESPNTKLLWLYAPDYTKGGKMSQIKEITVNGTTIWTQNDECSGFIISDKDCEYRTEEIELVSYIPDD